VAIIAVLVAIAIPMFTAQLEKSREATDEANLRSAYAVVSAEVLAPSAEEPADGGKISYTRTGANCEATVTATQTEAGWQSLESGKTMAIGSQSDVGASTTTWTVKYDSATGVVTITPAS
jgi:type IV pilus assembly protein PilA